MENQKQNKPSKVLAVQQVSDESRMINVTELKTYQPVAFNHNLQTYFTAKRPGMEGMTITFDTLRQIIFIRQPGKDSKAIVPANVAYMEINS